MRSEILEHAPLYPVFTAYNEALDEIKKRYDITEFNLIGHDGGANIAAVLASTRKDVVSLRTVAGNLHPDMVYARNAQKADPDNIRAIDIARSCPCRNTIS